MITPGNQTSQVTPNWNEKPLTTSKGLSENLSWKLMCDVIFPSFHSQSDIISFYHGYFSLRWLPLTDKFLKLHKIQTKNL